ncbi:MAG TPA: substrate-binding domain-containing protein [Polyangiaceae bacterium]|nr:substrate-binding domain-containing protein [Polyangiaceae bacterium]
MSRRKVIAFLTNNAGMRSDYQGLLRQGIEQACIERDIDLWVYAGRSDWRSWGAAQARVYEMVSPNRVDGVVVAASCIAAALSEETVLELVTRRSIVPTCAVGLHCPTVASVVVDNASGSAQLARHFASAHGARRFVYVAGPAGHNESEARLRGTRSALAEHGLELPATSVIHANFAFSAGEDAAKEFLRRGVHFDALIAANDDMAVGALGALKGAGLRCPQDVLIGGFDDAASSRAASPPLTTVRQPIVELGASAVARVLRAWEGKPDVELLTLPTEAVFRESCGCGGIDLWSEESAASGSEERIAESLTPLIGDRARREEWARALCRSLKGERGELAGSFSRTVRALLERLGDEAPVHELQHVIVQLRDAVPEQEVTRELETAMRRTLVDLGQAMHRREEKRRVHDDDLTERLRANWDRLSASAFDLPSLRSCLEIQLPSLSICNAFVGVYARDDLDSLQPLVCVMNGEPVALKEQSYPASLLLPHGALMTSKRCSLAVVPLTFEWQNLGIAVLELPKSHELYAVLREQIGSAVRTMRLHEDILQQARLSAQAEEEKRVTAERLRSLSLVAGGVAHDLNNVLGPLVGLPETISSELQRAIGDAAPPGIFEDIETLRLAGLRAADTIQDLLTLGQQNAAPKQVLDLNRLLASECRSFIALGDRSPRISICVVTGDEPLPVRASKAHLMRAISNLVLNAIDAIEGSGSVTVRAASRAFTEPHRGVETIDPGQYVVIEVEDTGAGIAPENMSRILEPFFSSKKSNERRGGRGLGLAIVHRIAKDSLGFVGIKSEVGRGTTFSLYLPLERDRPVRVSSRPAPPMRGTERILVIDDEPVQLRTARRVLENLGYTVVTAPSGEIGLGLLSEGDEPTEFDLVMVDMMMPGLDGIATLERIRAVRPNQKALIVTGYTPLEADRGNDPWLRKPYTQQSLSRAVRGALDGVTARE